VAKSGQFQLRSERLAFEIHGHKGHLARDRDAGVTKPGALPFLSRRVIDFEDVETGGLKWIAVGEGVVSRAQHHVLAHAAFGGASKLIFGIAAADRKKRPQTPGEGFLRIRWRSGLPVRNLDRQWVIEHSRLVNELVSRAPHGDTLCRTAGLGVTHRASDPMYNVRGSHEYLSAE